MSEITKEVLEVLDELLKNGVASEEIARELKLPIEYVDQRRDHVNERIERAKSADASESSKDLDSEYLAQVKSAQQTIAPIAQTLLNQIQYQAQFGDNDADSLNKLSQALSRLQKTLQIGTDATQDAILHLLETDILPEHTSAKIISTLEANQDAIRRKTRDIFQQASSTQIEQRRLF